MHDFKTMFPDLDEDVIEAVLRANQGAVDATIDQLLTMSTDNENERLRTEMDAADNAESPPSYSPTTPPPSYQQAVPGTSGTPPCSPPIRVAEPVEIVQPAAAAAAAATATIDLLSEETMEVPQEPSAAATRECEPCVSPNKILPKSPKKWLPPLLGSLPPDFLRINAAACKSNCTREMTAVLCSEIIQQKLEENERQRRLSMTDDPELVRYLEDERIALFLQNEEFMQELRRNKDFLSTLDRDSRGKQDFQQLHSDSDSDNTEDELDKPPTDDAMGTFPFTKMMPSEDSDAAFREKLKNMGKLSRRKFAQLARLFTRRKKRSAKQILSEGTMPSQDNLLLEDDDYGEDTADEIVEPNEESKSPHTNVVCLERANGPGA